MRHDLALIASFLLAACAGTPATPAAGPPRAGVSAAPPAAPPTAETNDDMPPAVAVAAARVRAAFAQPDDDQIGKTFSDSFLAHVPRAKLHELFSAIHDEVGECTSQELIEKKSDTEAIVRFVCAHGAIRASFVVRPAPPHLVDALMLKPDRR